MSARADRISCAARSAALRLEPRRAELWLDGWAGRYAAAVLVVGETARRYRVTPAAGLVRLAGRGRFLDPGAEALVPKSAIRFVDGELGLEAPRLDSLLERWAAKVDMSGGPEACWPWRGAKSHKRRGRRGIIRYLGGASARVVSAARVALALATDGEIDPRGVDGQALEVGHKCHNGGNAIDCVNPRHLYWCTREENEADKRRKLEKAIEEVLNA